MTVCDLACTHAYIILMHISCLFFFFANDLLLAVYFIFILDLKLGCKAVETTCKINNTLGPGTDNKCTVQW